MVKEIQICEYREKGKLSACKEVAWGWCKGSEHIAPLSDIHVYYCADHLQQCQICGGIFCETCLGTHGCPSQVFQEYEP